MRADESAAVGVHAPVAGLKRSDVPNTVDTKSLPPIISTRPVVSVTVRWKPRAVDTLPVASQTPAIGSNRSEFEYRTGEAKVPPPPPLTSTLPSANSAAVCPLRATFIGLVLVQLPDVGE